MIPEGTYLSTLLEVEGYVSRHSKTSYIKLILRSKETVEEEAEVDGKILTKTEPVLLFVYIPGAPAHTIAWAKLRNTEFHVRVRHHEGPEDRKYLDTRIVG